MKILYHHRIASKDGQYVHVVEILNSLRKQGHQVKVVSPRVNDTQEFGGEGGFVARLKATLPPHLYEIMEFTYAFWAFFKLLVTALRFRPDIIYERYNLFLPSGIWLSKLMGIPLLLEVNAPLYEERTEFNGLALNPLAKWSQSYCFRHADRLLPVTQVLADTVCMHGADRDKVKVIPNGVNLGNFHNNVKPAKLPDSFNNCVVVGFVGFCREWHGLENVIDILAELPGYQVALLIVGDGPAIPKLLDQSKQLNLADRVHFTGIVSREEMPNWVATIDIALQPAVVPYASPLKILEYMAMNTAIVAPHQANILELLEHEKTALLFDPDSKEGFKAACTRLIQDSSLREALAIAAKQSIDDRNLTWDGNAATIIRLSNILLKS